MNPELGVKPLVVFFVVHVKQLTKMKSFWYNEALYLYSHRYAESVGAKHYHTSAKQNKGIEELFLDLCKSRYYPVCYRPIHGLLKTV